MQIDDALEKIQARFSQIRDAADFISSPAGLERLDGLCMLFMAIGESASHGCQSTCRNALSADRQRVLKKLDVITEQRLLSQFPDIDWKGFMGFRDVIAHQYFDLDAEQVHWICIHEVPPLSAAIKRMKEML